MSENLDIDEIVSLAYRKGHAEGMNDAITAIDRGRRPTELQATAKAALDVMREHIAEARIAGHGL